MDTLIFIDAYLSNLKRASICEDLINQIRTSFPEYKLALVNKYPNSYNLESKVDYYFYYGDGIMLNKPPQEILDNELYERGYVYVTTDAGVCENWVPLVGVTDHAASNYDGYILSSNIAELLGYKKVFKIEYDTILDSNEIEAIKKDIINFEDYLLYGKRQEGQWAKPHHYLIDVHMIGYSTKIFKDIPLNTTDDIFWNLCETIGYYGKWVEYLTTSTIEYKHQFEELKGIIYDTPIRSLYPNSQFDVLNSPSYWTQKWNNIPKVCRVSYDKGKTEVNNEVALFFYNDKESNLKTHCKIIDKEGNVIYENNLILGHRHWAIDKLTITEELTIVNVNIKNGITTQYTSVITPKTIKDLPTRFLYEN